MALAAMACEHSPTLAPYPPETGLLDGSGGRMTYNVRDDLLSGHSVRGDEVFYTYCEDSKAELPVPCGEPAAGGGHANTTGDRCLGALPAEGGSRRLSLCGTPRGDADSIKQFLAGTRLADGTVVYVYLSRRTTASFAVNPALYLHRPGEFAPVRVHEFPALPFDGGVPRRLLPVGPRELLALGGEAPTLLAIDDAGGVSVRAVPGAVAADPATRQVVIDQEGSLSIEDLDSGARTPLEVPGTGWAMTVTVSVAMARGVVAITQRELDPATFAPTGLARVLLLRQDQPPQVLALDRGIRWGAVSIAPDGGSLVIERNGDLYRLAVAP
jgi:hypothetical protein